MRSRRPVRRVARPENPLDTIFFLGVGTWLTAWACALGLHRLAHTHAAPSPMTLFDTPVPPTRMETLE